MMKDYPARERSLPVRTAPPAHRVRDCSRTRAPEVPVDRRVWSAWVHGLVEDLARHLTTHKRRCARRV